jgi:cytochrome c
MKFGKSIALQIALVGLLAVSTAQADSVPLDVKDDGGNAMSGDPDHGETIFKKCAVCHSIKAGENRVGPSLHGVVGRQAGTAPNYSYSKANKESGITWSQQEIFVYLKNPQAKVPGTKMTFPGLPAPQDRADVIAYLTKNSQ